LRTTFGHPLKRYLRNFENYDRFLPYLSKAVSKSVIDIGSNVGDTLVLIKSISDAEVVCVEPDEKFIYYLKQNIKQNNFNPVKLYPFPISSVKKMVNVEKNGLKSTSNMSEVNDKEFQSGITTKTFQDLLTDLSLDMKSVGIIKSDTDGYDWDCLNSIADYFDSDANDVHYPEFIFYEHQPYLNNLGRKDPDLKTRVNWYKNSLKRLAGHGYTEFYVFDNFGSLIRHIENVKDLFIFLDDLSETKTAGKFSNYFLDVLLSRASNHHYVEKALRLQTSEQMVIN